MRYTDFPRIKSQQFSTLRKLSLNFDRINLNIISQIEILELISQNIILKGSNAKTELRKYKSVP